jgi:diadenosine tetraphosphatase ApaH/serine/threonine PP2A family protein phosphatase
MHGGLSPSLTTVDDISLLRRLREPPHEGAICDILFSEIGEDSLIIPYNISRRGAGFIFGPLATEEWLKNNNFTMIIRAELSDEVKEGELFVFDSREGIHVEP